MSDYGCCTLSACYWADGEEGFGSCDDCPFYDKDFFKEVENDGFKNMSVLRIRGQGI